MKSHLRRILSTAVALVVLLGGLLPVSAAGFSDVPSGAYYAEAVRWAVDRSITQGVTSTSFKPNGICSRAEAVTFLWRFDYMPHFGKDLSFTDVPSGSYYYDAVRWAVDRSITAGVSKTKFAPNDPCTRGQIVTFLWNFMGKPKSGGSNRFQDVAAGRYYSQAVCWAAEKGITNGTTATTFSPDDPCTRAQIVTMLYRFNKLIPVKKLVVLDPGHQSKGNNEKEPVAPGSKEMKAKCSSGTYGPTSKLWEYELNLTVSFQLREALERRGYRVLMTRESHNVNLSNIQRAQFANKAGADIAIRIHANGAGDSSVSGVLTVCMTKNNPNCKGIYARSRSLSDALVKQICAKTGARSQGVWETDTMTGLNWSTVPVSIVEMGYMSNPTEDRNMATASYQKKIVNGICDGVDEYFAKNG